LRELQENRARTLSFARAAKELEQDSSALISREEAQQIASAAAEAYDLRSASAENVQIRPPAQESYGVHPTLSGNNHGRLEFIKRHFAARGARFSGAPPKDNKKGSVEDYSNCISFLLEHLTRKQETCQLSRQEFLEQMMEFLSDGALSNVSSWVARNMSVEQIYEMLMQTYHKGSKPHEAQDKLNNIQRDAFRSIHEAINYIDRTARDASFKLIAGRQREEYRDRISVNALERILPEPVKCAIVDKLDRIKDRGREVTFNELSLIIKPYDAVMETYFKQKSGASKKVGQVSQADSKRKVEKKGGRNKAKNSDSNKQDKPSPKNTTNTRPNQHQQFQPRKFNRHNPRNFNTSAIGNGNSGQTGRSFNQNNFANKPWLRKPARPKPKEATGNDSAVDMSAGGPAQQNRGRRFYPLGSLPCNLCPGQDHTSNQCELFPPDQREPAGEKCNLCDWSRRHKRALCPVASGKARNIQEGN
jgi:DNA-binding transcriptional ArsR family regulator